MHFGELIPIVAILSGLGWGWLGYKNRQLRYSNRTSDSEVAQLQLENRKLHERIETLERIATDRPSALTREIEGLR